MYTEGFENLEEAESESHRTFRSSSETDRLLRENEKLKKSLEKEKFFNKLLDQEIQELKAGANGGNGNYSSEYWGGKRRVSRSAFYTLLFITLVMAGYIGYGIYYDKKFDYLNIGKNIPGSKAASTTNDAEPDATTPAATSATNASTNVAEQPKTSVPEGGVSQPENVAATPPPAAKDSVPNIIGDKKPASANTASTNKQKQAAALTPDEEYNEEEVNATLREETKPVRRPSSIANKPAIAKETETTPSQPVDAKPAEPRAVIAKYRVTSKANFYNSPDENTMRSTFISESANKIVNALEDRNGFIYVEYTNDLGFTSKGWLSKTDLTKE